MLYGSQVLLRARHEDDVPILHSQLYDDVATRCRADNRPWVPLPATAERSPYAVSAAPADSACFSVVEIATGALAGEAVVWGIHQHQRSAHLGLSLLPDARGRGLGADVVRVLCHYGFVVRGLHRLQIETVAENEAMLRAARSAGFTPEGRLKRQHGSAEPSPTKSSSGCWTMTTPAAPDAPDTGAQRCGRSGRLRRRGRAEQ